MTLHIDDPELDALVQKLAEATGESPAVAVKAAVKEQLEQLRPRRPTDWRERVEALVREIQAIPVVDPDFTEDSLYDEYGLPVEEESLAIGREIAAMPVVDPRTPEEMLYDERGLPK